MTTAAPLARSATLDTSVWYLGSLFSFLTAADETGGTLALLDITTWQGGEPPRHIHHAEDETFYLLDGGMTFYIGDDVYHAQPGTVVFAPRGIAHSFTVDTATARLLELITPGASAEHFRDPRFSEAARALELPPRPDGPPDVGALVADLARYQIEVVGPPGPPLPTATAGQQPA